MGKLTKLTFNGTEYSIGESGDSGSGFSAAFKTALLNAFAHVVWIDQNGQVYYNALASAMDDSTPTPGSGYTITNILTNVTNSNTSTSASSGASYTGTLSAAAGYTVGNVSITMGGTDITSTAYNSTTKVISVASVSGNIIITAQAVAVSGEAYDLITGGTPDYYLSNGVETPSNNWTISPYLSVRGQWLQSELALSNQTYNALYDTNKGLLSFRPRIYNDRPSNFDDFGAYYLRVSNSTSTLENAELVHNTLQTLSESTVWQANTYYSLSFTNQGYINLNTGEQISGSGGEMCTDFLNCYNATILTDNKPHLVWHSYAFYDSDKYYISGDTIATADSLTAESITVPSGARYVRVSKAVPSNGLCFKLA